MNRNVVSNIIMVLLLMGTLTLAFKIQSVHASGTIYIRADGSIDPPTANITSVDNVTYTFNGSIYDSIVVERNNIVIDGNGYTLQGTGAYLSKGIHLSGRTNVTVRNTHLKDFYAGIWLNFSSCNSISGNHITNNGHGIWLRYSSNNGISGNTFTNDGLTVLYSYQNSVENNTVNGKPLVYLEGVANYSVGDAGQVILINCTGIRVENLNLPRTTIGVELETTNNSVICGNHITNNSYGIWLHYSSNNSISGNNIAANRWHGIVLYNSWYNSISGNNIANNGVGIFIGFSSNNGISGNNITNNGYGIIPHYSSQNFIYHNNFVNNARQTYLTTTGYTNVWDDGYPSGGNYWSDYTGVDANGDGIGDTPYIIDANNRDRYPLMNPYGAPPSLKITSINPLEPFAYAYQYLTILGEGFVSDSKVYFNDGSTTYPPIPKERTRFIDSNSIEVVAGLGYTKLLWKVWVTNPDGSKSNELPFETRKARDEEIRTVLTLALQYWTDKDAVIMTAIAGGESGWNPNAAGDLVEHWGEKWDKAKRYNPDINDLGVCSWGLWQILMPAHKSLLENLAQTSDLRQIAKWLRDPNNNVRAAYEVWKVQGFGAWSAYTQTQEPSYYKNPSIWNRVINVAKQMRISIYKCPVNVTITDDYGRVISEVENQIPGASFEYFNQTATKVFYLPLNLTYQIQLNATNYGNCTIGQITPLESIYETAFSQVTFNLTSETMAEFDLLPYDANYTLKVDENGDGLIDYELTPEVETLTTEYDVGITEIVPSKTIIGQGYNLPINITVMNYGAYTETFNVTLYVNETIVELQTVTLASGNSTTLTFIWNTTGVAKGNYTIWAYALPIQGETETTDNTLTDGWVLVTIPGDVNGDHTCDMKDIFQLILHFMCKTGQPCYVPNYNINCDGVIDMKDIYIAILNFMKKW